MNERKYKSTGKWMIGIMKMKNNTERDEERENKTSRESD